MAGRKVDHPGWVKRLRAQRRRIPPSGTRKVTRGERRRCGHGGGRRCEQDDVGGRMRPVHPLWCTRTTHLRSCTRNVAEMSFVCPAEPPPSTPSRRVAVPVWPARTARGKRAEYGSSDGQPTGRVVGQCAKIDGFAPTPTRSAI